MRAYNGVLIRLFTSAIAMRKIKRGLETNCIIVVVIVVIFVSSVVGPFLVVPWQFYVLIILM